MPSAKCQRPTTDFMVLLQHKLSLRVSQRQILTPGLVQMVSVLALNKLELKDMINAEMVENPVLEELENSVPLIDDVSRREEERERIAAEEAPPAEKKDSFEEIDFGSFFKDYLEERPKVDFFKRVFLLGRGRSISSKSPGLRKPGSR